MFSDTKPQGSAGRSSRPGRLRRFRAGRPPRRARREAFPGCVGESACFWAAAFLVNYFDRIKLSVAAPQLRHDFSLTDGELGWLFSGFFWSYALMQIPTGMILDRFGVTRTNRCSTLVWSIISASTAFASGFGSIFGARILLGAAEGGLGAGFSCKCQGHRLLVSAPGALAGDFDLRCRGQIPPMPSAYYSSPWASCISCWRLGFAITASLSFLYFLAFAVFLPRSRQASAAQSAGTGLYPGGRRCGRGAGCERRGRHAGPSAAQPEALGA